MKASKSSRGPPQNKPSSKPLKSRAQANVSGYEKRQARKAKSGTGSTADVYEYIPEKGRRSKVTLDLDRDEAMDFGSFEDMADEEREELRAKLIGEHVDDEEVASEDDEEIDSDAAFEESDEDRFAGFFSNKKKGKTSAKSKSKPAVRFAEVDLNEDDDEKVPANAAVSDDESVEEEEEGEDDEFIDLLDVLDGKGDIDMGSDDEKDATVSKPSSSKKPAHDSDEDVDEDDDSEPEGFAQGASDDDEESGDEDEDEDEDDEEDDDMVLTPSDDELMPDALDQLQDFVSGLDVTSKKRKATDDPSTTTKDGEQRTAKRRLVKEKNEAGQEDEFRAHSAAKLNLDDLLAPLASQSSTLQSLKKTTKVLSSVNSTKAKTLSAPLPQRAQERLDREAAYEQTKEEVDKWSATMKRIKEAEHLSFPLQAKPAGRVSNLELNAKFKPTTALESSVDALLRAANLREEDLQKTEDTLLKTNQLTVEEVAERRIELRKMRELTFRAEIKARRTNKIKSKTYRKLRRKEKERLGEKIDEQVDSDDEEVRMKREIERAKERATLRHKHTGKWARQMRNKEGMDDETRRDIEEMLERGEKLRRRIKGIGSDESEDDNADDDDDDDDMDIEESVAKIKQRAFEELQELETVAEEEDEKRKGKSVFEMKFMKDAAARQAVEANLERDDFIRQMGGGELNGGDSDDGDSFKEPDPSAGVITHQVGGRIQYRPGESSNAISISRTLRPPPSDTSSVTLKSTDLLSPPPQSPVVSSSSRPLLSSNDPSTSSQAANPWLVRDTDSSSKVAKKKNEVVVSKDSKSADKSKNKLKKQMQKLGGAKEQAKDDAAVEVSLDNLLAGSTTTAATTTAKASKSKTSKTPAAAKSAPVDDDGSDSDSNSELEAQEKIMEGKGKGKTKNPLAFQQRDLVALAFAGDNVVQTFEEAKRREIAEDAPREVDMTIPGWGSWGGAGVRKAAPKPERIKKIAGIDPKTRADYNKKNIIISEKRDKKASKYTVKDLPYPYTSKEQFERAMERPLGTEWNTRVAFQRATLPRVMKKPGVIIDPLEKVL